MKLKLEGPTTGMASSTSSSSPSVEVLEGIEALMEVLLLLLFWVQRVLAIIKLMSHFCPHKHVHWTRQVTQLLANLLPIKLQSTTERH